MGSKFADDCQHHSTKAAATAVEAAERRAAAILNMVRAVVDEPVEFMASMGKASLAGPRGAPVWSPTLAIIKAVPITRFAVINVSLFMHQ